MDDYTKRKFEDAIKELEEQIAIMDAYKSGLLQLVLTLKQDMVTNGKFSEIEAIKILEIMKTIIRFGTLARLHITETVITAEVKSHSLQNEIYMKKKFFRGNQ